MGKTIRKRSGKTCCVPGCYVGGNISKIKFYRFPGRSYNLEKKAKWIKAINRINKDGSPWEPNANSRICSQHFVGGEKSEHPHSPAYIPTIFPKNNYDKQDNINKMQFEAQNRFDSEIRRKQIPNSFEVKNSKLPNKRALILIMMKNNNDKQNDNKVQDNTNIFMQSLNPQFCEAGSQVDFYEEETNSIIINMFSMIDKNGVTCDAATQANISLKVTEQKFLISKSTTDIEFGPTIVNENKQFGPNHLDEKDPLLVYQREFQGDLLIKEEQDYISAQ